MHRALPLLLLAACPSTDGPADADAPADRDTETSETDAPSPHDTDLAEVLPLPAARAVDLDRWATVEACVDCHTPGAGSSALTDPSGHDVSPPSLWAATMMGNAARDPIWRAVLEHETTLRPAAAAAIEDKCMTCHAPMAQRLAADAGELARAATLWGGDDVGALGLDGVGCTVCHQIAADGLGTPTTYTGAFQLGPARTLYGPHADPFDRPMVMRSDFTPAQGGHITDSALCGSCHTVITPVLDADGGATGASFHEQTTYLEWRSSAFVAEGSTQGAEATSCQGCHVPVVDEDGAPISTRIARNPQGGDFGQVAPRSPFGRHVFVGANTLGLSLLRDHADDLRPRADAAAFNAQILRTQSFLAAAVHVEVGSVRYAAGQLTAPITVTHDAGHRFPSGFPSRRAWLEITVTDGSGAVVFRSGGWDAEGRLVDQDGAVLPSERSGGPVTTHVDVVDDDAVVAQWTQVLGGLDGSPTHSLLTGALHLRDDRLLPRGWSPTGDASEALAVVGVSDDPDFVPGGDTVHLSVQLPGAVGPLTVRARVVYQPLSARWRAEVVAGGAPAALRLDAWLAADRPGPEVLATDERTGE